MTRLALAEWGMNGIADNALLITAELVTNAMNIGDVFHLTLSGETDTVLIEVSDSSEAAPDPQQRSLHRVDGRGLLTGAACCWSRPAQKIGAGDWKTAAAESSGPVRRATHTYRDAAVRQWM